MKKIMVLILVLILAVETGCAEVITVDDVASEAVIVSPADDPEQLSGTPVKEDGEEPPLRDGEEPPARDGEEPPARDGEEPPARDGEEPPTKDGEEQDAQSSGNNYSIDQAISDNAQLTTIAFSGLAFLTGTEGADAFFPPGKVADFFGFQYMRDVDVSGYGHNTTFLTKVASNMLYILSDEQIELLKTLAEEQEVLYEEYGYGRLDMIDAFRQQYEDGETLDYDGITEYSSYLYEIDGQLSYHRAEVFGQIISTLTDDQIDYINQMSFNDSSTWPDISEEGLLDKKSMSHLSHVAVMTYASEFFSWYAGSVESDVYFCPERHGTYFGGFYMKDYPAMGDANYFISTSITGESGKNFLEVLNEEQRLLMTSIVDEQKDALNRIVEIRNEVVAGLRLFAEGQAVDETEVMALMKEYGALEGELSYRYATRFSEIGQSLTEAQQTALYELRDQYVFPEGSYLYSAPIAMPVANSDSLLED